MATDESRAEVAQVFRDVHGVAVATLVRVFGDITVAEDAVQEAFVVATQRWGTDSIPPNPAGWIITTARNRAIDQLRRSARGRELVRTIGDDPVTPHRDPLEPPDDRGPVADDRLRLMFTCCHPALRVEHQVALTLRLLGGLSVEEIARGFLVSGPAMARRLGRAKYKIKAANIPYRVPGEDDIGSRLRSVLSVLYLIYNAGTDDLEERVSLRLEAIRLARSLATLLPSQPETAGLLALLLLNESRVPARQVDGKVALLRDQDRSTWDDSMIEEGHAIVRRCIREDRPGPFQIQAAIQAVHCDAETFAETDWPQIVTLYDQLFVVMPTPVVALNRAIALAETEGPEASLVALDEIGAALADYSSFHAATAALLRRIGRSADAAAAYERAAALATSDADRAYLSAQIDVATDVG